MQPKHVHMIGCWSEVGGDELPHVPGCPDPADLTGSWRDQDRQAVLDYLHSGVRCRVYVGDFKCLLCDETLGGADFTDGEWVWPEGLSHYVSEHGVRLPEAFLDKVRGNPGLPATLNDEIGDPQTYLMGHRGIATPVNAELEPNINPGFGRWLDWAAANTPARPLPDAISLDNARQIAANLSHDAWQAIIKPVHGRWQVSFEPDGDRVYLPHCSAEVLAHCLGERRPPDPTAILGVEQADQIAAEYDGDWGAARILAIAPRFWFVWVKPLSADWPTSAQINDEISGGLELGWAKNHADNCRSFATREMDEYGWRQVLERERSRAER